MINKILTLIDELADTTEMGVTAHTQYRKGYTDGLKELKEKIIPFEAVVKPANGGHIGECRICFEKERDIHHFDLYVTGSEGIWMCEECRTILTENIRIIKADNLHKKLKREKESRLSV